MSDKAAIIICPSEARIDRPLLGLTIGERLLLSLSYSNIRRIAFVGPGPRPSCERATFETIEVDQLRSERAVLVVPSDLVLDRKAFGEPRATPPELPLAWVDPSTAASIIDAPEAWLSERASDPGRSGEGFAIRVHDSQTARAAERALLGSLRKPIDGVVSRNLNRHVSLFTTRFLVKLGLSPNVFTVLFMFVGLASAIFVSMAEYWWAILLGAFLFQAQSILDGCDGEMARLTYRFSHIGQWLDSIGDDVTNYAFCLGLALGQARLHGSEVLYIAGFATLAAQVLASGIMYRRMLLWKTGDLLAIPDTVSTKDDGSLFSSAIKVLRMIAKRDTFVLIIAVLAAVQLPRVAFWVYAGGTFPMLLGVVINDLRVSKLAPTAAKKPALATTSINPANTATAGT
ncbi:MAG: CDP-alcohol phosphatidyltransferase family protein [Myxococcales bacterium]|nr:CDP-alcohol phosphatidyltransferase family protein [Myxococcales bacterium]